MSVIAITNFVGLNPDIAPELLPNSFAVEATNVFVDQGCLNALKEPKRVGVNPVWNTKTGTIQSLFLLDNERWLAWDEVVSVAMMQKESNADWEVIFTGLDKPRYTNKSLATAGGGKSYPEVTYPVGIPAPSHALVATKTNKTSPAGSVRASWKIAGTVADSVGDRIARSYIWTYVNDQGREGPPSAVSNIVYTNDDETVTLTATMSVPQADINKARIYTSATGGTFNYLKEVTLPQTSITITDNTFGSPIETTTWDGPPDGLTGLVSMANGMLAGYVGNTLYFSEPYQSHAWPYDYSKPMDYEIRGLAAVGNMLFISTAGYPLIGIGNHPSYITYTKLGSIQANQSDRSIVDMGDGAIYAAADGLVKLTNGNAEMISDGIISERIYHALNPSSIHGYFYRDKYIGFYDSGLDGIILSEPGQEKIGYYKTNSATSIDAYFYDNNERPFFYNAVSYTSLGLPEIVAAESGEFFPIKGAFILDTKRKMVTFTTATCTAAFSDKVSGKLYMVNPDEYGNNLYEFNEGYDNLAFAWRSKPTVTTLKTFTFCKVRAKRYPVTFELYVDDVLKTTVTVLNKNIFRLPGGYKGNTWAARISGVNQIDGIFMAESMEELQQ